MVAGNDYELGVFNGDVGLVRTNANGTLSAYFEKGNGEMETDE